VSDESKMTPRLRAESEGVMVTLEGIRRLGSETLASCLGSPITRVTQEHPVIHITMNSLHYTRHSGASNNMLYHREDSS